MSTILRSYRILTIINILIIFSNAYSQISISSSDILALKGTTRSAFSVIEETDTVVITPGGLNQIWDYRDVKTEIFASSVLEYLEPEGGYRSDLFPDANFRQRISTSTDEGTFFLDGYINITSNIFRTLGSASEFGGFSIIEIEDDDAAPLPMTYGTNWISVSSDTSDQFGIITITNDSTYNRVDASGTLRLSMGDIECLRLREMSKIITETSFNGIPVSVDTTYDVSFVWLSKNHLQTFIVDSLENNLGEVSFTLAGEATSVRETSSIIPKDYSLNQNYPNPFNPSTIISYSIPVDDFVNLKVYDALGREVAVLDNGYKSAGSYTYNFDANNLSSGLYFYTIRSGKFVETKKMLLIR